MDNQIEVILDHIGKLITSELDISTDKSLFVELMKANCKLYDNLINWYRNDKSFDGWVALSKEYYYSDIYKRLDRNGTIKVLVDLYFSMDLKPHFDKNTQLDEKDIELLAVKSKACKSMIDHS